MKHMRDDYSRIQDPEGKIPEDEPVFLLRAQDICAPGTVNRWIQLAKDAGASKEIIQAARRQYFAMCDWQVEHTSKVPDM